MNIAIIFAGGVGKRMGAKIPKQFLKINDKPILIHTLEIFQSNKEIDKIYISTMQSYIDYVKQLCNKYKITKMADVVEGGNNPQESIYNALNRAKQDCEDDSIVLIHDGVRPYITDEVIKNNIEGVKKYGNAITCTSCYETIIVSKDGNSIVNVPYRKETFTGQAPQSFYLKDIFDAHNKIRKMVDGYDELVDQATLMMKLGKKLHIVEGNRGNIKVTTPEDVYIYKALLKYKENKEIGVE